MRNNNIKDGLYNRANGNLPLDLALQFCGNFIPQYSRHSIHEAVTDKLGPVNPPRAFSVAPQHIVELTVENGVAVKAVVRLPYQPERDLVLVLKQPEECGRIFVVTLWTNCVNDNHSTLNNNNIVH